MCIRVSAALARTIRDPVEVVGVLTPQCIRQLTKLDCIACWAFILTTEELLGAVSVSGKGDDTLVTLYGVHVV